jgi:hypothetical protein
LLFLSFVQRVMSHGFYYMGIVTFCDVQLKNWLSLQCYEGSPVQKLTLRRKNSTQPNLLFWPTKL